MGNGARIGLLLLVLLSSGSGGETAPWTLEEAHKALLTSPRDPFLQFAVLQLARRDPAQQTRYFEAADLVRRQVERDVDLTDPFSGAAALLEAAQLDAFELGQGSGGALLNLDALQGPAAQPRPGDAALADRKPSIPALATLAPEEFWFATCRSPEALTGVLDRLDAVLAHVRRQSGAAAGSRGVVARFRRQLALQTWGEGIEEIALAGSDPFVLDGSDLTVILRVKDPQTFRAVGEEFGSAASGEASGIAYETRVGPAGERLCVAWPEPTLQVRSNSEGALRRVLAAFRGERTLAASKEFAAFLARFPEGAADGVAYFSGAFLGALHGPRVRIADWRRMRCYAHLRMIQHGAMLWRAEHGAAPAAVVDLVEGRCLPEGLACPEAGTYALAPGGEVATCSRHGRTSALVPCIDLPVAQVTQAEAARYKTFVSQYEEHWRAFFEPVGFRFQSGGGRVRIETMLAPTTNPIWMGLGMVVGSAEPQPLDAMPVPPRTMLTAAMSFNKLALLLNAGNGGPLDEIARELEFDDLGIETSELVAFVRDGIGEQVSVNAYDADPPLDINLAKLMPLFGPVKDDDAFIMGVAPLMVTIGLGQPAYAAIPVRDPAVVDRFLGLFDRALARFAQQEPERGWFNLQYDFYLIPREGGAIRAFVVHFGPVEWRIFWGRVGNGLYAATKPGIFDDLAAAPPGDGGPKAHAMLRLRADHWKEVLRTYRLGWEENRRRTCLAHGAGLSGILRAFPGQPCDEKAAEQWGFRPACPDGGRYESSPDGGVACSIHGTPALPRQPEQGSTDFAQVVRELTMAVRVMPEGVHVVAELLAP